MKKQVLEFLVNGEPRAMAVAPNRTLLEILREDLGMTGTKCGCNQGACGACTVLIDGKPTSSCLVLGLELQGRKVTTIESLAVGNRLHPLQQAFIDQGAVQCGFCTPGMLLSAKALLDRQPDPSHEDIKEAIAGNVCRCTGYVKIVEAIDAAARHGRSA